MTVCLILVDVTMAVVSSCHQCPQAQPVLHLTSVTHHVLVHYLQLEMGRQLEPLVVDARDTGGDAGGCMELEAKVVVLEEATPGVVAALGVMVTREVEKQLVVHYHT